MAGRAARPARRPGARRRLGGAAARGARRDAARLPIARAFLAAPDDLAGAGRHPRRRYGARQDHHPHLAPSAPAGPSLLDGPHARRLPHFAHGQLAAGNRDVRPGHPRTPLPRRAAQPGRPGRGRVRADHLRHDAPRCRAPGGGGLGTGRRRRGTAHQEPLLRDRQGAAHPPGQGAGGADRHPGGEQPLGAVGDPGLDDPGAAGAAGPVP